MVAAYNDSHVDGRKSFAVEGFQAYGGRGSRNMTSKNDAFEFLEALHRELERQLPPPLSMQADVSDLIRMGKSDARFRHLNSPEHAFTRGMILPKIHTFLTDVTGLSTKQAREAFLAESCANYRELSTNTPARTVRHPFNKALVSDAPSIYRKWAKETKSKPLTQSCPDFALRSPCPHKIVFEAKYFKSPNRKAAERELVAGLYQAFFYRALPPVDPRKDGRTWDYDYACLIAYDASPRGVFKAAWDELHPDVRKGFSNGANVYAMILTGS